MNQHLIWKQVNHPDILPGYLVSPEGYIKANGVKDEDAITSPSYQSTNGYDFMLLNNKDGKVQLFPIDDIIAIAYIPVPISLKDKPIKVLHINGDTRDISLNNLQWIEDIEEWRVCTYPGVKPYMYEVSSLGRVRNCKSLIILKGEIDAYGYIKYGLMTETGSHIRVLCHRLVLCQFGIFKLKYTVNHINGIKTHNIPKNLESVTSKENTQHAIKCGLKLFGEKHWKAKVTINDVEQISKMIVHFKGNIDSIYNEAVKNGIPCTKNIVNQILRKQNWKNVSDKYFNKGQFRQQITSEEARMICKLLIDTNFDVDKTTDVFNQNSDIVISRRIVYNIKTKARWKHISDEFF